MKHMPLSKNKRAWLIDQIEVWLRQTQPKLIELAQEMKKSERNLLLCWCDLYERYRPSDEEMDTLEKYRAIECRPSISIVPQNARGSSNPVVAVKIDKEYGTKIDGFKWPRTYLPLKDLCTLAEWTSLNNMANNLNFKRKKFYNEIGYKLKPYKKFIYDCKTLKHVAECWPPAEKLYDTMQQRFHGTVKNYCSVPIDLDSEAEMRRDLITAGVLTE